MEKPGFVDRIHNVCNFRPSQRVDALIDFPGAGSGGGGRVPKKVWEANKGTGFRGSRNWAFGQKGVSAG